MPEMHITFEVGGQSETLTIPDDTIARLQPMVEREYLPRAGGSNPTLLDAFIAGLRWHLVRDLKVFERQNLEFVPPDFGGITQ